MGKTFVNLKYLATAPGPLRIEVQFQAGGGVSLTRGAEVKTWLDDRDRASLSERQTWFEIEPAATTESTLGALTPTGIEKPKTKPAKKDKE